MIVQINSISSETPTSDYIMVKDGQPEISSGELGTPPTATKSFGSRVLNPGFSLEPSEPPSETNPSENPSKDFCRFSWICRFCRSQPSHDRIAPNLAQKNGRTISSRMTQVLRNSHG